MKRILSIVALAAIILTACGRQDTADGPVPSGTYAVDPDHAYVTFSYLHQGLSYPLLRATNTSGELEFDADEIENSSVAVAIAADSIRTNVDYFDKELASRKFFNATKYPHITFTSDSYESVNESEGILRGSVTIRDVTRPLELGVTLNNALIHPIRETPVIGFSATGSLSRSEFGLDRFVPVVSDTVEFSIEIEFLHGSNDASAHAAQIARDSAAGS